MQVFRWHRARYAFFLFYAMPGLTNSAHSSVEMSALASTWSCLTTHFHEQPTGVLFAPNTVDSISRTRSYAALVIYHRSPPHLSHCFQIAGIL
jgi:hypothetical protein